MLNNRCFEVVFHLIGRFLLGLLNISMSKSPGDRNNIVGFRSSLWVKIMDQRGIFFEGFFRAKNSGQLFVFNLNQVDSLLGCFRINSGYSSDFIPELKDLVFFEDKIVSIKTNAYLWSICSGNNGIYSREFLCFLGVNM